MIKSRKFHAIEGFEIVNRIDKSDDSNNCNAFRKTDDSCLKLVNLSLTRVSTLVVNLEHQV